MLAHLRLGTLTPDDIPPHWLPYILAINEGKEEYIAKAKAEPGVGSAGHAGRMATPDRKRQILEEVAAKQQKLAAKQGARGG